MRYLKERKRLLTVFDCFSFSFFFGFQRGPNLCQGLTLSKCWQVGHTSSVVKNICQIWEWLICNVCTLVSFFFWFGLICHIYGWMDGWILQIIRTRGCIWCALLHRFRDDGCSVASNAGIVHAVQSKLIILLFWILDLLNWLIWIMNNLSTYTYCICRRWWRPQSSSWRGSSPWRMSTASMTSQLTTSCTNSR